jgi:hypothetical protein
MLKDPGNDGNNENNLSFKSLVYAREEVVCPYENNVK